MVKFKVVFLMLISVCMMSCLKDENPTKENDFSVLGLSALKINEMEYAVRSNGMIDIGQSKNIRLVGSTYNVTTGHLELEYSIMSKGENSLACNVKSLNSDVQVSVNTSSNGSKIYSVVEIKRPGFKEVIVYRIYLITI